MPRPKSIIWSVEVDEAMKAHNCQHNRKHRLERGDKRLSVSKDRSVEHYCRACALEILARDIQKLQALEKQFDDE